MTQNGIPNVGGTVDPVISQTPVVESVDPMQIWLPVLACLWLAGIVILLGYTAYTYFRLHVRVKEAVRLENNVYMSENAETAFVLGLFRPKIYLPYRMHEKDMHYVIAHEKTHIRGLDHWWKVVGFLLLAIHWFNPVMWFAYILLCRDMELACDEKVIKDLDETQRADYSQALLGCSVKRRMGAACPIAFGEVGVKQRIRSVLNYRKNGYLFGVAALLCGICIAVFFMTDPKSGNGFGVTDFRFVQDANDGHPQLELDYRFLLEGEAYFHSAWIREVGPEEGELGPDGMGEYDGALGQYRMMIPFKTTPASYAFRQKYKAGQVYTLDALERYPEPLKFKVVYPPNYSVVIYVGSEKDFSFKDPALYHVRYLGGTMKIEMFGPASEKEESKVLPSSDPTLELITAQGRFKADTGSWYATYTDAEGNKVSADGGIDRTLELADITDPCVTTDASAQLTFSVRPENFSIQCWPVSGPGSGFENRKLVERNGNTFQLKKGCYMYRIVANWTNGEGDYKGIYYYFYVELTD